MSKDIKLKSRYGAAHTLKRVPEEGENVYRYVPAKEWMPIYVGFDTYDENADVNELKYVDADGGPWLGIGSKVEELTVVRIYDKKGVGTLVELK